MKPLYQREQYNYDLPERLIAQEPLKKRDQARLMVIDRKSGSIQHDVFKNISNHVPASSCWVTNNSKVRPVRLQGVKESTGGSVEIFILKPRADGTYEALIRPLKRLRNQDQVIFAPGRLRAEIVDTKKRLVRFNQKNLDAALRKWGHMPLPPYIKRPDRNTDRDDYQTVYARHPGSVATPTAGLHFTRLLIDRLEAQGHRFVNVTLHINYGTFRPVEVADIRQHKMHVEEYEILKGNERKIATARRAGRSVIAVGTTSCRVLESHAQTKESKGATGLFIYPGYTFQAVDILLTNFHLPQSTLLMLVSAFGGYDLIREAYRQAVLHEYRFFSYGDAMLIC